MREVARCQMFNYGLDTIDVISSISSLPAHLHDGVQNSNPHLGKKSIVLVEQTAGRAATLQLSQLNINWKAFLYFGSNSFHKILARKFVTCLLT